MLQRIKDAGLTIRPDKCALVKQDFQYLEFLLGKGVTRPQVGKVDTIMSAEKPRTKAQVISGSCWLVQEVHSWIFFTLSPDY